jgi:hypothetical protein
MSTVPVVPTRCPLCDSELRRETVRPPCPNGCTHANGEPRLAELAGPRSGRPVCSPCALREQQPNGWTERELAEWSDARARDGRRENGAGW